MILLIDNYDSFVFNLARYCEELGQQVNVFRNDSIGLSDIQTLNPSAILLSPGPCGPKEAGISLEVVKTFAGFIPILGICLGHQVIGEAFGGKVRRAKRPMHGKSSLITHKESGLFYNIPSPFQVGRYHSLIVEKESLDSNILVTAYSDEGEIMAFSSPKLKLASFQFHPESVLTTYGHQLLQNFIEERY